MVAAALLFRTVVALAFVATAQMSDDPLTIQGEFDPEQVERVLRTKQPELRRCYDERLSARPELRGALRVRMEIGSTGRVTSARVIETTLADGSVESCVVKTLRALAFKRPLSGTVIVNYPMQFRPRNDLGAPVQTLQPLASRRLSERSVSAILREQRDRFTPCYQQRVQERPELRGTPVTLTFSLDRDGQPSGLQVHGAHRAADIDACLVATARGLRFPRPVAGEAARVSLPIVLWP